MSEGDGTYREVRFLNGPNDGLVLVQGIEPFEAGKIYGVKGSKSVYRARCGDEEGVLYLDFLEFLAEPE